MSDNEPISRRQWLERLALPAMATAGAAVFSENISPSPPGHGYDKLTRVDTYDIRDYGAVGDGKTLNTKSIQSAIDDCHASKGGIVIIPTGEFLCGTIELKSNITLHLAAAAKLLGSPKREDYVAGTGVPTGNGNIVFLYAVNAQNISIEGNGTIDGNGTAFYNGKGDNTGPGQHGIGGNFDRPHLAIFYQCDNLRIRDAFFTASAYHCFRILGCKRVFIDGVSIYNRVNKNNDGFHFNNSEYVHISNSDVRCQDDACALFGSNKFVTINNCSFSTRWSVFRFGSGNTENIAVTNCLIYETYGCPIKISAGKAKIENLFFSNIIMRNVTGPIGIGFSGPSNNSNTREASPAKSFIRNIVFNNIRATVVAQPVDHPDIHFGLSIREGEKNSCITLNAMGDYFLENISFSDVHVTYAGGGTAAQAGKRDVPKIAAEYFGVWDPAPAGPPAYGLFARNVKGLTLHNVRLDYEKADARPAIIFDNVQDASISMLSAKGNKESELLRFINTKEVLISSARVLNTAHTFLKMEGAGSAGIVVDGGDLRKAMTQISFDNGALKESVTARI